MARTVEDDLFRDTTMTFGEHLEELRGSLFKAVLSLAVGFILGLFVGNWVVQTIQYPLVSALEDYYSTHAVAEFKVRLADARATERLSPLRPRMTKQSKSWSTKVGCCFRKPMSCRGKS